MKSIYERMIELYPETEGEVANTATGGAPSAALQAQARAALDRVASPRLVLVQTIDGDIRCDGRDGEHVLAFAENVAAALDVVTAESPDSAILVVEDEQARVCAQYARCHDDGNVLRDFDDFADGMMSADGNHLTPAGQAQLADLLWPTVEEVLAEVD